MKEADEAGRSRFDLSDGLLVLGAILVVLGVRLMSSAWSLVLAGVIIGSWGSALGLMRAIQAAKKPLKRGGV